MRLLSYLNHLACRGKGGRAGGRPPVRARQQTDVASCHRIAIIDINFSTGHACSSGLTHGEGDMATQAHMHVLTWFGVHTKRQLSNWALDFSVVRSIFLHGWTGGMRTLIRHSSGSVCVVTRQPPTATKLKLSLSLAFTRELTTATSSPLRTGRPHRCSQTSLRVFSCSTLS